MADDWAENRKLSAIDQEKADKERRFSIGARGEQSCETCFYWGGKKYGDGSWSASWCLRHAPAYGQQYIFAESPFAHDDSNKRFPSTLYDDWCGDWTEK